MTKKFEILNDVLIDDYCSVVDVKLLEQYLQLQDSELSIETFSFYTSVSAVFSSKIEGEPIELDSYVKFKRFGVKFLPDYTQKIDDLYTAYVFAKTNSCNQKNLAQAHQILSAHFLPKSKQGTVRGGHMYATTNDGRIEYVAAAPSIVTAELDNFFTDLGYLLAEQLSIQEVFYYAALIHLVFVKIHPFEDGNGRMSRLLEKWFLAEKLGEKAWLIQSEKQYYTHHQTYYRNLRRLGLEYDFLDYRKSLNFLKMLPLSLNADS